MKRSGLVIGLGVLLMLVGAAVAVSRGTPPVPSSQIGHVRVEASARSVWTAQRGSDFSSVVLFFRRKVRTPRTVDHVDVTMTLSGSFKTSEGDYGEITADVVPPSGPGTRMRPGSYKVTTPGSTFTTTSLTWVKKDLPAAGRTYGFELEAQAFDGSDHNLWAHFKGGKRAVVIEMWPAGH